jgi:Multiprotein bridging factor 1
MSDDWHKVVHIGSGQGGGLGVGSHETVLRSKAQVNAARRTGNLKTELRAGSANSVSLTPFPRKAEEAVLIDDCTRNPILNVSSWTKWQIAKL